jgi:hypothetical protein
MAVTPESFFSFAAEHVGLLKDVFYRTREGRGMTEAELMGLIRRHSRPGGASSQHVLDRLQGLGFIESAPDATAHYTLTPVFGSLLAHVLQEYRTTSVEVIQGYLNAFDTLAHEVDDATLAGSGGRVVRALIEMEQNVERLRQDSRANRDAILNEVIRTKANRDGENARQRYERINWLWTRYLVPMRDIIDTTKAMDAALDRLERSLDEATARFRHDGAVAGPVGSLASRLLRLRRCVIDDFRESLAELAPLYESLRLDSAMARGASLALDRLGREGARRLHLAERLGICDWRLQGLFDDGSLRCYLLDIRGYRPTAGRPLARGAVSASRADAPLDAAFDASVSAALPIPDAMAWLIERLGAGNASRILRGYGRLHTGRLGRVSFESAPRDYELPNRRLRARPMRVEPVAKERG